MKTVHDYSKALKELLLECGEDHGYAGVFGLLEAQKVYWLTQCQRQYNEDWDRIAKESDKARKQ